MQRRHHSTGGKVDKCGTRYNSGYRHWIEGCLRNGGRFYIGKIKKQGKHTLDDVEALLYKKYGAIINVKVKEKSPVKTIEHSGNVMESIEGGYPLRNGSSGRG